MRGPLDTALEFEQALLSLDRLAARNMLLEPGGSETPLQLVETLVVPALERIGAGWEQGRVTLSQVYMSGRICEELVDTLLPSDGLGRKNRPKTAIAVLQDYHLGKCPRRCCWPYRKPFTHGATIHWIG